VQEVLVNKYTKVECATCSGTGIIEDYCWKCNKDGSRKGTNVDCDRCNNTGYIDYICDDCNGEGVL